MRLPCALLVLLYLVTANNFVICKVLATSEESNHISGSAGALVFTSRKLLANDIKNEDQATGESLEGEDDTTETETELMLPDETDEESSPAVDANTEDKKKKKEQPLSELEDEQVTDSLAVEEKQQVKEVKEPVKKKEEKAPQPEESGGESLADEEKDGLMKEKTPSKKTVSQEQEQNTDLLLNEKQQVKEGKKSFKRNKLSKKKASSGETAKKGFENVNEISNLEIEKEKTQLEVEASSEDQYQVRRNSQKKQKQPKKQKLDLEADQESNVDVETTDIVDQKVEEDATQYDFEAKTKPVVKQKQPKKQKLDFEADQESNVDTDIVDQKVEEDATQDDFETKTKPVVTTKKDGKLKKKGKGTVDSELSTAGSADQVTAGQKKKKDKKTSIKSRLEDTGANAEEGSEEIVSLEEEGYTDDTLLADVTKKPKKGSGKKVPSAELDLMEDESVEDDTQGKLQKKEKSTSKKKEETLEGDSENMDEIEVVKEKPTPVSGKQKEKKKKTQNSVLMSNKDLELQVQENENKADEALDTESENIETVKKTDKKEKPVKKTKKEKTSKIQKKEEVKEEGIDPSSDDLTDKKEVGRIQPKEGKKTQGKDGSKKATDSGLELQLETDPRADENNEPQAQKSSIKVEEQELKVGEKNSKEAVQQQHTSETKGSENVFTSKQSQGDAQEGMISATDNEDDEYGGDFMQDFGDLPTKFQDTAQKVAGHLGPNIQKITDTSKTYFNKANQQITESFSPLVGKQFAPLLASLISYGLLLVPLAVVILLFEHIRALVSLQKVMLFVNIYLAAYFVTLLLATFIIGEPMAFFYKSSPSGYVHLQLLQALGYILYLVLQTVDLFSSCTSEKVLIKVTSILQWLVAFLIGLHYYVTVFHRAMGLKGPRTSWKIYGIYSISFFILCLFARLRRTKKGYTQVGDADTNKKN